MRRRASWPNAKNSLPRRSRHHLSDRSHRLKRTSAVATFAHCKNSPQPTMTNRSTDPARAERRRPLARSSLPGAPGATSFMVRCDRARRVRCSLPSLRISWARLTRRARKLNNLRCRQRHGAALAAFGRSEPQSRLRVCSRLSTTEFARSLDRRSAVSGCAYPLPEIFDGLPKLQLIELPFRTDGHP
jgi:hypothetical protein